MEQTLIYDEWSLNSTDSKKCSTAKARAKIPITRKTDCRVIKFQRLIYISKCETAECVLLIYISIFAQAKKINMLFIAKAHVVITEIHEKLFGH